jgi:hypothetical protein
MFMGGYFAYHDLAFCWQAVGLFENSIYVVTVNAQSLYTTISFSGETYTFVLTVFLFY